jgi:hypothetical protein
MNRERTREAALANVAREAKGVAQSASLLAEGVNFRLALQSGGSEEPPGGEGRVARCAAELADGAAELERLAERLAQELAEAPQPTPVVVSEGLRAVVSRMLADGRSEDEVADYLRTRFDIPEAQAIVSAVAGRGT